MTGTEELRPKLASKMAVATFLAGFSFTALLQILTSPKMPALADLANELSWVTLIDSALPLLATISLTAATALFIAAVYIFDRLSMPERFWFASGESRRPRYPKIVRNKRGDELVYAYMIYAWIRVFTPGVILASIGFILIVIDASSIELSLLYVIVIIAVGVYYWVVRPELGVD